MIAYLADLARARTRRGKPSSWETLDPEGDEAQAAAQMAMDWYNENYEPRFMAFIVYAEKQVWFQLNMPVCIYLGTAKL